MIIQTAISESNQQHTGTHSSDHPPERMINYYAKKFRQQLERHSCLIAGLMLIAAGSGIAVVLVRELPATHDACASTSQGECDLKKCCSWCGKHCTNVASANASCTKSPTACELSRDEAQCTAFSMCQWHQTPAHILCLLQKLHVKSLLLRKLDVK
jgi:hypothetical protein